MKPLPLPNRSLPLAASDPAVADSVICGYRFAVARPTLALACCSKASEARMSGR